MKSNLIRLLPLLLLSLIFAGCSTTYKPGAPVPNLAEIPTIQTGAKVSFVNAQPATEKVQISQFGAGGLKVNASLHDWTEQAIQALTRTLKKKGVDVGPGAAKPIKIAITKVTLTTAASGWTGRCTVVFTVDTGDGNPFTLGAEDTSWKWANACDASIQKLVLVTLNDERVLKAIKGS